MTIIEKIYCNRDKLMEKFVPSEGTKEADAELQEFLKGKGISEFESEEYVNGLAYEIEKQGFVKGFQMAVALFTNGEV